MIKDLDPQLNINSTINCGFNSKLIQVLFQLNKETGDGRSPLFIKGSQ